VFGVVVFKKDNRGLQIKTMHLLYFLNKMPVWLMQLGRGWG